MAAETGQASMRVSWGIIALIAPIVFQAMFRKRGGFLYRKIVLCLLIGMSSLFGVAAGLVLPWFGKAYLINDIVCTAMAILAKRFLAITVTIDDKENAIYSEKMAVYVCNHQSIVDILILGFVLPKRTSMVAKKSIKMIPVLGWFMTLSKAIFLDRANRKDSIKQAQQAAEDIHRQNTSVWLFPEGTRSNTEQDDMLPFKKGAFHMAAQAKVPIVPMVVQNYSHLFSSKRKHFGYGEIKVKVLPAVDTTKVSEGEEPIDDLITRVREQMLVTLKEFSSESAKSK